MGAALMDGAVGAWSVMAGTLGTRGRAAGTTAREDGLTALATVPVMEGGRVLRGTLIAESLRNGIVLEGLNLRVTRVVRGDFGDEAKHQPRTWTVVDFEVAIEHASDLAASLERGLDAGGPWYCDFGDDVETFVVFGGRSFRYVTGDSGGRARAICPRPFGRRPRGAARLGRLAQLAPAGSW